MTKNIFKRKKQKTSEEMIIFSKHSIKIRSICLLACAILSLLIALLLEFIAKNHLTGFFAILIENSAEFIENVSGIVFGASVGTLMLDFFSYIKYAQERIKEVIIDKDFLRTVSDEEKKNIITTLESSLYFKNEEIPEDSLYTNIKQKVIPLLDSEYFEKYHTHIDCEIKDGKIYKTIYNNFTIFSHKDNASFKLPFSVYYCVDDIKDIEDHYDFKNFYFNNTKLEITSEDTSSQEVDGNYNCKQKKYSFKRELPLIKGYNTISYELISVVDISDNVYARTLTLPCKNFAVDFHLNSDDYTVTAHGFAIDKTETVKIQSYSKCCRIEFLDWVIPGDGFIFIINKKKENSK